MKTILLTLIALLPLAASADSWQDALYGSQQPRGYVLQPNQYYNPQPQIGLQAQQDVRLKNEVIMNQLLQNQLMKRELLQPNLDSLGSNKLLDTQSGKFIILDDSK